MTTSSEREQAEGNIIDSLWNLFCSLKLALILILILATASLIGALLPQAPLDGVTNSAVFDLWLEQRIRPKYGSLTDLFNLFNLFDVYNALWFHLLMGALALNVIICTVNRLPGIWSSLVKPRVRMNEAFYSHSPNSVQVKGKGLRVEHFQAALRRRHYRVKVEEGGGRDDPAGGVYYIYGDRNGWAKLGTIATHLSLVLFLVGALVGQVYGFADDGVSIAEGQVYEVNREGYQFGVRNDKFTVEFYPDGRPSDFRSDLVVVENGQEVVKKTIRVNDPLTYEGLRFHQSSYGAYAMVEIRDSSGNRVYSGQMDLYPQGSIYGGSITLPGGQRALDGQMTISRMQGMNFQLWDSQGAGPTAFIGQGQTGTVGDLQVTLQSVGEYTVLRMVKDPGAVFIWIASVLMVVGVAVTFYFPRRRIWGRIGEEEGSFGGTADRFVNLKEEQRKLVEELKGEVSGLEEVKREAPVGVVRRRKRI